MDLLLNTLTEWLKELLAGAIASNLTGMVDSVNTKVGDIAAQVGQTPQGWNSGIFHMIQNLSNNVILPIAGIILALVMTMEFIRIIMDKNNMHDFDTWSILMWVFKTACAILIVSNTWNIVMAVFDVSQTVVNNAAGMIVGNTDILIERVKESKSLVDIKLTARACQEHYINKVDSFIIVSSDSDYWGLISSLPDARFLMMIEHEKSGPDLKAALVNTGIFYCYIDDFYSGNADELKFGALIKEMYRYIDSAVHLNVNEMFSAALKATRIEISDAEKKQFMAQHIRTMQMSIAPDGEVVIEFKNK